MKFKQGDIVKAVMTAGCHSITSGQLYEVLDVRTGGNINIKPCRGPCNWFNAHRFELVHSKVGVQPTMNINVGDTVVRTTHSHYLKIGEKYTVRTLYPQSNHIAVEGYPNMRFNDSDFIVVPNLEDRPKTLGFDEVCKALKDGTPLQYFFNERWIDVQRPDCVSIGMINKSIWRYAVRTMDYYGKELPAPIENYPESGLVYGISLTKHEVYKCNVNKRLGQLHYKTAEDAHAVLTTILAPFGITPKALDFSLTQEAI